MIIQDLRPSPHVQGRYLVFFEDGSLLKVSETELLRFSLYVGREVTPQELAEMGKLGQESSWKERAILSLSRKPQSRRELERRLEQWGCAEAEVMARICDRLEELGYLNDREYAQRVVRHYSQKGYGMGKLRQELYQRGVPRPLWEEALEQADANTDAIDAFLRSRLKGTLPEGKEKKRVADALARRGFSWGDISQALARYEAWAVEQDEG